MRVHAAQWLRRMTHIVLLALAIAAGPAGSALAQTSGTVPTQQQLEIFRNLPPDQQRAVLDAVRGNTRGDSSQEQQPKSQEVIQPLPMVEEAAPEELPPRLDKRSTVILAVEVLPEAAPANTQQAETLRDRSERIAAGNPYELDDEGRLALPFLPPMPLQGLTDLEATQRLNADPRLAGLRFTVTLLPLRPIDAAALEPFGYKLFTPGPGSFAPTTDIPVPADYVLGPGDNVIVELFGKRQAFHSGVVDRNGVLTIPEFGPIRAAGMKYEAVRAEIERLASQELIGVRASVKLGDLRSIRIFVLGDVPHPGSYTVSGLSTVTNALVASGGVSKVGSLRNISVKRGGSAVGTLDLYDLLLAGDTSRDIRIQPGDAIFVPPVGATAGVAGRVRRPAIYELRAGATAAELLRLSGGAAPDADLSAAKLESINAAHERVVRDLDLTNERDAATQLRNGDLLRVPRVLQELHNAVSLEGQVQRPGQYAYRAGMHLTDLLGSLDALQSNADQRYVMIRRELRPGRRVQVISADAVQAFERRGSADDPVLESRDRVVVYSMQRDRGVALKEVVDTLRLQARDNEPIPLVSVSGRTRAPGQYPLEPGMTVRDLIRAGGGLDEAAYALNAELTRFEAGPNQSRQTEVVEVSLADVLAGNPAADLPLRPYDVLMIKQVPEWSEQGRIRVGGEVRFPGDYPIRKGETLSSVIRRAGGLTEHAFAEGAVFTREEIKAQEQQQIETLANRLQSDLALLAVQTAQTSAGTNQNQKPSEALTVGQSLLTQLRSTKPTGRLVVNVEQALAGTGSDADIQLRGGDLLLIPPLRQYVTVLGEVQNPTSHVWRREVDRDGYLQMSGGFTQNADQKRVYVVRANGSVVAQHGGSWFGKDGAGNMHPGDTVVVPLDTNKMRPLPLWTAVSTIIYNSAVAVAAIASL
jgi:protein involved in polysaccharide export with SLBB domain